MPTKPGRRHVDPPNPDDIVRMNVAIRREDRARFKFFCERAGHDMEQMAALWLLDRLADEERKLAKGK